MRYAITLLVLCALCGVSGAAPAPEAPVQRRADFLPLGVYWPGEHTFGEYLIPKLRWREIDKALVDLAAHHVNAIWLTHISARDAAEFARHAAQRNIYVVASLGELAGEEPAVQKADHAALVRETLNAWGDAPPPIAWGLADEPRAGYMDTMAKYVQAWKAEAPREPVTCVAMWGDVSATAKAGFDVLCSDVYPFFSPGNPNNYGMPPWAAWKLVTQRVVSNSAHPWMMGQGYQEPWGPYTVDENGNIVYLPGGAPHWEMPTQAQMKWQAWSQFALGGKGMFFFLYRFPTTANPTATPCTLPAVVNTPVNSHAPRALVYDDGRPTPQYDAMGEAYAAIAQHAALLASLQVSAGPEAWITDGGATVVNVLLDPTTQKRYLIAVGSFEEKRPQPVTVILGPHITGLTRHDTGVAVPLTVMTPFRTATLTLPPGDGVIYDCTVDATNLPSYYADQFTDDRYQRDAIGETSGMSRYNEWLSSKNGNLACITYDVDKLLGPAGAGSARVLLYSGGVNGYGRGAFWSMSADGVTFAPLSENAFDTAIPFATRYLRVGLSWQGASTPHYGHLSRLLFCQWKQAAK